MIESKKCQLNIVQGLLALMNIEAERMKEVQIAPGCEEDQFYDDIY